ncbi:MAG: thioesterase family protein [Acidimicrobiales bacterium]
MDLTELLDVLTVEPDPGGAPDVFVGHSPADRDRPVYGGQFLAQALRAAGATVEPDRRPHSLHAYFVRSGAPKTPIRYEVTRVRDGRSFSHREVVATQDGKEVFRQIQSFQVPTDGLVHSERFPVEPGFDPAREIGYRAWVREASTHHDHPWFGEQMPLDIRFEAAPPAQPRTPLGGVLRIWMRITETIPSDDPTLHAALLAWMSDKTISDVVLYPHARSWTDVGHDILSLDHAMWFYDPARADQWVLFTHETPATTGGRGLARGDLVTLSGQRVGAVAQEALLVTP